MTTAQTILANLEALGFDNESAAALYGKISQSIGQIVDNTLTELSNSENSILNIINTQRYGKSGYYTMIALAFQYGYDLITDPVTFDLKYSTVDIAAQIINQAAFEEIISGSSSQLFLKVATLDPVSGLLIPLSADQLNAFTNYFVNFEIPGVPVTIVSNPANILSFNANIKYYATYDLSTLQANVINALNSFRESFAFNGEFFAGDLNDYMKQNVPGIRDFYIFNTTIDGNPFAGSQSLSAGYFNYIANIQNNLNYQTA